MLKLNNIDDEGAKNLADFYSDILHNSQHPLTNYEAHFNIGLMAWRAQDLIRFKDHLTEAASAMAQCLVHEKNTSGESRIPHHIVLPFFVIMNFGPSHDQHILAQIDRKDFFSPECNRYKSLADLLDVLRGYYSGSALSSEALDEVIATNNHPETDVFYRSWINALCVGLQAILQKDTDLLEKSMNRILQLHEQLAWEGGWGNLAEGLLSFWALTLQTIAKKEGINLNVESPYLPKIDLD